MVTVVKIGGSLFPEYTDAICEKLMESDEKIVLVNGGGEFANKLRRLNDKYHYSDDCNHWTAIESMDIIGRLIADRNDNIELISDLDSIEEVHKKNKIPLLLTFQFLRTHDELEHSWDVTSDSIACFIANCINAKLLILTNVNGIYNGNISSNEKKLIKNISANELLLFDETCVDKSLPKLLIKYHLSCYIINGMYPDRVLEHLNSSNTMNNIYTYIGGE